MDAFVPLVSPRASTAAQAVRCCSAASTSSCAQPNLPAFRTAVFCSSAALAWAAFNNRRSRGCRSERNKERRACQVKAVAEEVERKTATSVAESWFEQCEKALKGEAMFDDALAKRGKDLLEDAGLVVPTTRQEPWRYTNMKALFQTEGLGPVDDAHHDLDIAELTDDMKDSGWWQLVFVDGCLLEDWQVKPSEACEDVIIGGKATLQAKPSAGADRVPALLAELPEVDVFMPENRGAMGSGKLAALNQAFSVAPRELSEQLLETVPMTVLLLPRYMQWA